MPPVQFNIRTLMVAICLSAVFMTILVTGQSGLFIIVILVTSMVFTLYTIWDERKRGGTIVGHGSAHDGNDQTEPKSGEAERL
jgi:hypothetical protein